MISVRDSLRLSEKINFQDIWLGKFVWAAHDFGYINLAKFHLMMMMTICIDWLGRTQRGLSEINRS